RTLRHLEGECRSLASRAGQAEGDSARTGQEREGGTGRVNAEESGRAGFHGPSKEMKRWGNDHLKRNPIGATQRTAPRLDSIVVILHSAFSPAPGRLGHSSTR